MSRRDFYNMDRIEEVFDREALRRICLMSEEDFAEAYDMTTVMVAQKAPDNFYHFKDNDSSILAVAHLDTVGKAWQRDCHFLDTEGGEVVYSRALDDRLGAYVILELLPQLGITCDVLLTVGEESGQSTASFFDAPKDYDWIIEFDRGGTDVVMYQYEDEDTADLVRAAGAKVGEGIFSDICFLDHLNVKAFNWGVGYQDYHSARSHAYLEDTFMMVTQFLTFHAQNEGIRLEHEDAPSWWSGGGSWRFLDDDDDPDLTNKYEPEWDDNPSQAAILEMLEDTA